MSQNTDQYYIDKVISGDTQAFSVLVDRYKHMVFTLAMKILKNREEAEEVSQDAFVKAYTALPTFKGASKFSTWLYKIAYYRSLDYLKRQGRSLNVGAVDVNTVFNLATTEDLLESLDLNERKVIIKNAISELPENDSLLITLHYLEEQSLKEISDLMGISVNNVKVRLFRSRKRLAVILQNKLEPETLRNYGRK